MERPLPTSAPPRPAAVPAGRRRPAPDPRRGRRSRRPIVALIVGAVVATALPVLGGPSGAAALAVPVTVAPAPAASPAPTTPTVPAGPPATAPAPAPGATFTVSPEVDRLLVSGLGLPLGASATLTGTAAGSTITIDPALPRALPLGLPAGMAGPAFAGAHIVIDPAADTLTLTATAGEGADARL